MNRNNFEWLTKIKEKASRYPDPYQYLLDRLYYMEKKNERLRKMLDEYNSADKKIPIILHQDTAAKFISLLDELITERNEELLFDKIINGLHSVFGYDRVGLMLFNDMTGKIEGARSIGLPKDYIENLKIDPAETQGEKMRNYVARCFSEKKSIFITDRFNEKDFNTRMSDNLRIYSTQYAIAPVYGKTKIYGVITAAVRPDNQYFMTENEIVILEFVAHQIGIIIENSHLNAKIEKFYKDIILTFSNLVEFRDECTAGHCNRLIFYSKIIGRKLNFSFSELREIEIAAALHDIGKICTPDNILNKPSKLTPEEYDEIKKHSLKGAEIVQPLSDYSNVINAIKYHHERWDGMGYPEGLKGAEIPFYARILAVIDSFDVMINYRPYKKPLSITEAKKELEKCAGSQFDPAIVRMIIDLPDDEIIKIQNGIIGIY